MNREEMKTKAKAAAKYAEDKAEQGIVAAEGRWPIGTAITFLVIGMVLGAYLWSLWPHK